MGLSEKSGMIASFSRWWMSMRHERSESEVDKLINFLRCEVMPGINELNEKAAALLPVANAIQNGVDNMQVQMQALKDEVVRLQNLGSGATPEQLNALGGTLDQALEAFTAIGGDVASSTTA